MWTVSPEKSGLMDFAQNQVARGMDTAHVFGIATEIGVVRARSLAEGLHEHVVGNLFYRLLVGIDYVCGRQRGCGSGFSGSGGGPVKIPWVEGLGVTVDVSQRWISEPGAVACEHGIGGSATSRCPDPAREDSRVLTRTHAASRNNSPNSQCGGARVAKPQPSAESR